MKKKTKRTKIISIVPKRRTPILRFSPTAWAKLIWFRDYGRTEIGGFGITDADDLLFVRDFVTVKQTASTASVEFDDEAVADFFDEQVDSGLQPEQFGRLWIHTHPGESAEPSVVDEETFNRVFGGCTWAVMFVVGTTGKTHARLRFNVGPQGEAIIPVEVDYRRPFEATHVEAWQSEYDANITPVRHTLSLLDDDWDLEDVEEPFGADLCMDDVSMAELAEMDEDERTWVLAELGYHEGFPAGGLGVLV